MRYFTDWTEAVLEARRINKGCNGAKVYSETVLKGSSFNVEKIKKERKCHTVHIIFEERQSRFDILDIR